MKRNIILTVITIFFSVNIFSQSEDNSTGGTLSAEAFISHSYDAKSYIGFRLGIFPRTVPLLAMGGVSL